MARQTHRGDIAMSLSDLTHSPSPVPRKRLNNKERAKIAMARAGSVPSALPSDSRYLRSEAWQALPGSTPVTLEARTGCCWPLSGSPMLFCNNAITPGRLPYCPDHLKRYKTKETTE